jgi:hypothetical protein
MSDATRSALRRESQAELAETRAALFNYVHAHEEEPDSFPRSATMRWLMDRERLSRATLSVLAFAAARAGLPGIGKVAKLPMAAAVLAKWLRR